jgi:hypothetical protein
MLPSNKGIAPDGDPASQTKEGGKRMKAIAVLFCLLLLVGSSAYGDQATSQSTEGSGIRQGEGSGSTLQGGPRNGPPPEAFKACEGKAEGMKAQFTGPDGQTITGACRIADGRLVLRPDRPAENSRDGRRGPPPEAYKACEGKTAGATAQFVDPRGETMRGTCEEESGKLVLRPDANKAQKQGRAR